MFMNQRAQRLDFIVGKNNGIFKNLEFKGPFGMRESKVTIFPGK